MDDDVRTLIHDLTFEEVGSHHRLSDWNISGAYSPPLVAQCSEHDPEPPRPGALVFLIVILQEERAAAVA